MSNFQRTAALLTLSIGALASLPALADDIHYNQISLRAEASQEVPRDLMIVTLYTEAQNTDAAKPSARPNPSRKSPCARAIATATRFTTTKPRRLPAGVNAQNCALKALTLQPCPSSPAI